MDARSPTIHARAVVCRYVDEVVNHERLDLLDQVVAPDYVFHCPDGDLYGHDGARLNLMEMRQAFPDLRMDLIDTIAEGDLVSRRFVLRGTHREPFLGLAPTDKPVAIPGIAIDRVANGRIVETWITLNVLELVRARSRPSDTG